MATLKGSDMTKDEFIMAIVDLYLHSNGRPTASQCYEISTAKIPALYQLLRYIDDHINDDQPTIKPEGTI